MAAESGSVTVYLAGLRNAKCSGGLSSPKFSRLSDKISPQISADLVSQGTGFRDLKESTPCGCTVDR